jgi:hypothetical protein
MKNVQNCLITLMLPIVFYSSSALAVFDGNLNRACEKTSGSTIKVYTGQANPFRQAANINNQGDQCSEIPDAYRINIYKFGTCTADPFVANDFSTCEYFINSDNTPVVHTIVGVGSPQPLATTGSIAPGTYPYGFMILDNSLEVKHTQTYDNAMYSNPNGGGETSGTTCWSINYTTTFGSEILAYSSKGTIADTGIECGAANAAAPAFTKEIFDTMGDGSFVSTGPGEFTLPSGNTMRAKLLKSDNKSIATSGVDAARIFARINFANDKVVTESSSFEIKFKITDAVSLDSGWDGATNFMVKMGADPFQVEVVVTN